MGRLTSSAVSQMLVVGLVVGAIPLAASRSEAPVEPQRIVLTTTPTTADLEAEVRYLELADRDLETDAPTTVEEAAIALAASLSAVPVGAMDGAAACPAAKLAVSWTEPGPEYEHGAFVTPLGPAPGPDAAQVNGVVVCEGYPFAFMGFEATRTGETWDVVAVPYLGGEEDGSEPANDDADHAEPAEPAPAPAEPETPRLELPSGDLGPVDAYAKYEPQRICHGSAKPGTDAMKRLLLGRYPVTRNLGIVRGCSIGGRSEHKEGRAFDWGAYVHRQSERAAVDDMIARMMATDEDGNRHALARRMGVMYIIWNQKIWSAYRPEAGWRPYSGRSPHTDHVHISLSWDGAMARTSFWNANGVEAMLAMPSGTAAAPAAAPARVAAAPAGDGDHETDSRDERVSVERPELTDEQRDAWRAEREKRRAEYERRIREWREARERRHEEREQRRSAGQPIDHESETEVAAREAEEAVQEAEAAVQEVDEATGDAERAERRARWEAALRTRRAEWEAEQQRRQEAREQREQEREERRAEERSAREQREAERRTERDERRAEEREARQQRETERRAEREQRRQAEREERESRRQSERERREQTRQERDERRRQAREEREAQRQAEREERRRHREERETRRQAEREERRRQRDEWRQRREEQRRSEAPAETPAPAETTAPIETPAPTETSADA